MHNDVAAPRGKCSTLVELLRYRTARQPDDHAYTFLINGETEGLRLTYGELDRQVRSIAALLQSYHIAGERALLLFPAGLEFVTAFLGCLYSGVTAVPMPPPNPSRLNRTIARVQAVTKDARPTAVLTTSAILALVDEIVQEAPALKQMRWLATDQSDASLAAQWQYPDISASTLAYLQYTSGSTALPKGVMVSHGNLIHNCDYASYAFAYTEGNCVAVHWMPTFHDYGLIDGTLNPLFYGFPCYLMSPLAFLQKPSRWLTAVSTYRATHTAGPNFSYELCVRKTRPEERAGLDLSCLRVAGNAAEPIRKETLDRFYAMYREHGFRWQTFCPAYGLAEATLVVSGNARHAPVFDYLDPLSLEQHKIVSVDADAPASRIAIGCGSLGMDVKVVIVHPETLTACPSDEVGEIWTTSPSLTQGYWNCPEETERTLRAHLADTGEGPFLRTGDLGFIKHGELFVTGRLKDLIIIHGRNLYPQDIELSVEQSHPCVRPGCCAAFAVEVDGGEHLVVVVEVEGHYATAHPSQIDQEHTRRRQSNSESETFSPARSEPLHAQEVIKAIRGRVAHDYDLPISGIALIQAGSILKTSSGKVQRQACRQAFLQGTLKAVEVWTRGEEHQRSFRPSAKS